MVLGSQGPGIHDFYFIQLHSCHFLNRFFNLTLQSLVLNSANNKCKITLTLFFSVVMLGIHLFSRTSAQLALNLNTAKRLAPLSASQVSLIPLDALTSMAH